MTNYCCHRDGNDKSTASAIKKSRVNQQHVSLTNQKVPVADKDSLWQRMLSLTSQLTQSKLKQEAVGAARSIQKPSSGSSDTSKNPYSTPQDRIDTGASNNNDQSIISSDNLNRYSQTTSYPTYRSDPSPTQSEEEKRVQYRRLQQYWDEYYKRYYESIGKGALDNLSYKFA